MKRFLILLTVACGLILSSAYSKDTDKSAVKNTIQKKSVLAEPPSPFFNPWGTSMPYPFTSAGSPILNPKTQPQISTGYYFVDSDDKAAAFWRGNPTLFDTTEDESNWRRIVPGPSTMPSNFWTDNPSEGLRYFRNPDQMTDSVDNAFAGPIPIGFNFAYNGILYDSFYVSTNGLIALSNSRYSYIKYTNIRDTSITQADGKNSCYNPQSMDWFFRGGRQVSPATGWTDATPDNYGYLTATGNTTSPTGGIRNNAGALQSLYSGTAAIAPFYGDLLFSQWDSDNKTTQDYSKVKFYRDQAGNKLIVYYINAMLTTKNGYNFSTPYGTISQSPLTDGTYNYRPWMNHYHGVNAQITLDRRDSSVTVYYYRFDGRSDIGITLIQANEMFRYNTTCGVTGYARHYNYDSKNPSVTTFPTAEYQQTTIYFSKYLNPNISFPKNGLCVKFKQWKNTLRVVDLAWRVRKKERNSPNYTEPVSSTQANNYEILAGHDQVGQIQPVAIVENMTNDVQGPNGVNYQQQDLRFRVRLSIVNQAQQKPVYDKFIKVDSTAIALKAGEQAYEKVIASVVSVASGNYTADTNNATYYVGGKLLAAWKGIPPYGFVQVYFPPFEPNYLFDNFIGRMTAFVIADPTDPGTNEGYRDTWPFDDTMSVQFFVMRRIEMQDQFKDDVTEYHVIYGAPMPSVYKWVSINADVVTGEQVSRFPLAPRGEFECNNWEVYPGFTITSPCIKLDRVTEPTSYPDGDELRSYPINMLNKKGSVLTLSVQRVTNKADWERGWSDGSIQGCEHRVIQNQTWYNEVRTNYDRLNVEFAKPAADWRTGVDLTNLPLTNWQTHQRRGGAAPVTGVSAYSLFGGGGYQIGFLESDKDSALAAPVYTPAASRAVNGLRQRLYDDGVDFQFNKIIIPIPDQFILAPNEGGYNFRFRLKASLYNNRVSVTTIPDDNDDFFVDNLRILYSTKEDVDVEITSARADWKYTLAPASQAIEVPIKVNLNNNTSYQAPGFWVKCRIVTKSDFDALYYWDGGYKYYGSDIDSILYYRSLFAPLKKISNDSARAELNKKCVYCRTQEIPFLMPGADVQKLMQNWNAREVPQQKYVIIGNVYVPGGDLEPLNDTTYSEIDIKFGPVFAYDPVPDIQNLNKGNNDVPGDAVEWGRGLTTRGYVYGGTSSYASFPTTVQYGDPGGDGGSGSFAMKFELLQQDTLKGYQVYFGAKNQHPDVIRLRMFDGDNTPTNEIEGSLVTTARGWDDIRKDYYWDQYVTTNLGSNIVLNKGKYWVVVSQLAEAGIELGATKSKSGMRTTNIYQDPYDLPDQNGTGNFTLLLEKTFRVLDKYGNLLNDNFFAFENGAGSNQWVQFTPTLGNPGYGHLPYRGHVADGTITYSRGSWLPLVRPYLGDRWIGTQTQYVDCSDTVKGDTSIPVELTNFKGQVRSKGIDLFWETSSEINNFGFYVERRLAVDGNEWKTLGFVKGSGTTNSPRNYNYSDTKVEPSQTYQYRLRQVDANGTQSCDNYSQIVTLTYEYGSVSLDQNVPNPFYGNDKTAINFSIPEKANVRLEILDLFGNTVKTLVNRELSAGSYTDNYWDGKYSNGNNAPTGSYIYRLTVGSEILSGKMSLVR